MNVLIFLVPFVIAVAWKAGYGYRVVMPLAVYVIVALVVSSLRQVQCATVKFNYLYIPAGILWIAMLLSWIFGEVRSYGMTELILWSIMILTLPIYEWSKSPQVGSVALTDRLQITDGVLEKITRGIVYVVLIASIYGLVAYMILPYTRFAGNFISLGDLKSFSPNGFGSLLAVVMPLGIGLYMKEKSKGMGLTIVFLLSCLILTLSRGAFLGMGFAVLIWLVKMSLDKNVINTKKLLSLILTCCIVAALLIQIKGYFGNNLAASENSEAISRVTLSDIKNSKTFTEREQFWNTAVSMIEERPLLGFGPGSFSFYYPAHNPGIFAKADHPHNLVLKLAAENGVVALVAFIIFVLGILYLGYKEFIVRQSQDLLYFGIWTAFIGLTAAQIVDYTLNLSPQILLFGLLSGALIRGLPGRELGYSVNLKWWKYAVAIILICLVSLSLVQKQISSDSLANLNLYLAMNPLDYRNHIYKAGAALENGDYKSARSLANDAIDALKNLSPEPYIILVQALLKNKPQIYPSGEIAGVISYLADFESEAGKTDTNVIVEGDTERVMVLLSSVESLLGQYRGSIANGQIKRLSVIAKDLKTDIEMEIERTKKLFPGFMTKDLSEKFNTGR